MQKDERLCMDGTRLADLLLLLMFEGRQALPKITTFNWTSRSSSRSVESDRIHRHLIECIRNKDTDALIEAVESGSVEVNFTDDVGQTLLNWASAFGTPEMVEYLCEKGADVNRGQRSSSLHYAACFGRPQVAKLLLRFGANPDLRDEEGKTPLDKARERSDEGHREVAVILENPADWMGAAIQIGGAGEGSSSTTSASTDAAPTPAGTQQGGADDDKKVNVVPTEVAMKYLQRLLPLFIQLFQQSLVTGVRRLSVNLMKKCIHYANGDALKALGKKSRFTERLVEVVSSVLDQEDEEEGQLTALNMMKDLLEKDNEYFLEHFTRLGILNKVYSLAYSSTNDDAGGESSVVDAPLATIQQQQSYDNGAEDAPDVQIGRAHRWRDWCMVRGRDCLYVWCDACALEFSNGSNGWFRFLLDGKLLTMYSSGSPECVSDNSENRAEFIEKFQRARVAVKTGTPTMPVLSVPSPPGGEQRRIVIGNWFLECLVPGELNIRNAEGQQQRTILKEDLAGFIFESNRDTRHSFTAETSLGPEFSTPWLGRRGRRLKSRAEMHRQHARTFAKELYEKYFQEAKEKTSSSLVQLKAVADALRNVSETVKKGGDPKAQLQHALNVLRCLISDDQAISNYEFYSSGLASALLSVLPEVEDNMNLKNAFYRVLGAPVPAKGGKAGRRSVDDEESQQSSAVALLIQKIISVLESVEKLPQYFYDTPGSSFGFQLLTRRFRLRLERAAHETTLIDRTGRCLKAEPLATVQQLKSHLWKMVAKQWYDNDRSTFEFVKELKEKKEAGQEVVFSFQEDFDENGLIYWLGTNGKTVRDWVNPAAYGIVHVTCSEGRTLPYGRLEDILSRDSNPLNCHTNDDK